MFRLHSYLTLTVACVLLHVTEVSATTYYVRSSGDDGNRGTSRWSAFRTIKKAASVAKNGDVVSVGSGTYADAFDLVGIQNSSATLEFRARYPGQSVISGLVRVISSNNVVFNGFRFEGAAQRPMIWAGSYDGLLSNCQLASGNEPVLVQDGTVTFDTCSITNFSQDGLQIDGEALVHLTRSTISGCQENGIEIRKVARVVLDDATVRDNLGDGISIAYADTSIDIGPINSGDAPNETLLKAWNLIDTARASEWDDFEDEYGGDPRPEMQAAKDYITEALTDAWWVDEWHLTRNEGDDVFASINNSAEKLQAVLNKADEAEELEDVGNLLTNLAQALQLLADAAEVLAQLAIDEAIAGGGDSSRIDEAENEMAFGQTNEAVTEVINPDDGPQVTYGPFIDKAVEHYDKAWLFSKEAGGNGEGTLSGGGSAPPNPLPPSDWADITDGELVIINSSLTGNANAVKLANEQSFDARYTDFSTNGEWGLQLRGPSRMEDCTVNGNSTGGVWLKNINTSDLTVSSNTIANNTKYGVFAETCDLTFDNTNITGWSISGANRLFVVSGGSAIFDGVTISGGTTAGVQADNSATLTVRNATIQNCGYGVVADNCTVAIENSTLSENSVGLYSNQNTIVVRDSSLHSNSLWGAAVYPDTVTATTATFENTAIHSNLGGLTLVNGSNGDLLLRLGTEIRDNSDAGLHFENCVLTINDQSGGANWRTLRNGYGIRCHLGTLNLTDVLIEESSIYGVRCDGSDVTLTDCTVSGKSGIYADAANTSLTVKACKLEEAAGTSGGWGLVRGGGNLTVSDSLFAGFDSGVYLSTAGSFDQANVLNATIANVTAYGVYLAAGDATVQNTIVHGNGASHGLSQVGGQLIHSHNLIDGFSTPFDGTSANDTEILKQPRFVDAVVGDFHLGKGSPAINAGADVGIFSPTDLEGNSRPSFNVFDIGAYEYMSPSGSFRVMEWRETQ